MKIITKELLDELSQKAKASERLRSHYNMHETLDEKIHRLLIAVEPNSYVRPHRHLGADKYELLTIIRGELDVLIYDKSGKILNKVTLGDNSDIKTVEISKDEYHSFISLKTGTVVLEVKAGPYQVPSDDDWCLSFPKEGETKVQEYIKWLYYAKIGEKF